MKKWDFLGLFADLMPIVIGSLPLIVLVLVVWTLLMLSL